MEALAEQKKLAKEEAKARAKAAKLAEANAKNGKGKKEEPGKGKGKKKKNKGRRHGRSAPQQSLGGPKAVAKRIKQIINNAHQCGEGPTYISDEIRRLMQMVGGTRMNANALKDLITHPLEPLAGS